MYRCPICGETFLNHADRARHYRFTGSCRRPINLYAVTCGFPGIQGGHSSSDAPPLVRAAAVAIALLVHMPIALYLISHLKG